MSTDSPGSHVFSGSLATNYQECPDNAAVKIYGNGFTPTRDDSLSSYR